MIRIIVQTGWSTIMIAAKNGHIDIVKYLAEKGFDMHYAKEVSVASHIYSN